MENAIVVKGIKKSFGETHALEDVDLVVPKGTILGLLGPNGAGKTTLVRILTTLLAPDAGSAVVAGLDLATHADSLRQVIGLAGQNAAVDENLTGRENLVLVGQLYHLGNQEAKKRADDLLKRFALTHPADRKAKTYSGGMRRRLDLAASLLGYPQVLFLDEPTTGLDPRSRIGLWKIIKELVHDGTTILLTTQYLEEADRLADSIAVIDKGRVIARGTTNELKSQVGGDVLELHVSDVSKVNLAAEVLKDLGKEQPQIEADLGRISLPISGGTSVLAEAVRRLDAAKIAILDLALHRPTLDDVFLALTGHAAEEENI